jgi:Flp pilus assembly protein CpaB
MVFLSQYRDSVSGADQAATVLVAKSLIEKGSRGDVVAEYALFQTTAVKEADLKDGAVSDPSSLKGKYATTDIFPGEQLVASEFAEAAPSVANRLRGFNRAIAVPLDESHGMIGNVKAGDRVDVLAGLGLQPAGGVGGPNATKPVVLRVPDVSAAQIALAADIGKVWLVLRAKAGAKNSDVPVQDLQSLALRGAARALQQLGQLEETP